MLIFGASREQQFDDFWTVTVDRRDCKVAAVKKLELKERDNLTTRNSMAAVVYKGKVVMFGGQDSEQQVLYNDLYTIDTGKGFEIKHV